MLKALIKFCCSSDACSTGAAVVELGLSAPIVILFVLAIVDYGGLMNVTANLLGATRAGAQYAGAVWLNPGITTADIDTQAQVCAFYGLSGTSCPPVTPSTAQMCTCTDDIVVACPVAGVGTGNPCFGHADSRILRYVTVAATQTHRPLLAYPGFAYPNPLIVQSVVRVE
jgi:Flp pilus assembly protein TadG